MINDAYERLATSSPRVQGGQVMNEEYYKWMNAQPDQFSPFGGGDVWQAAWNAALEKAAQVAYTQLSLGRITRPEDIRALKEE